MLELSPNLQTWVNVVLVWIGFGSLAGLVARAILPLKDPAGSLATLTLGSAGTAIGLGVLSWAQGGGPSNPISPTGFLAAVGGAFGLLVAYHFLRYVVPRHEPAAGGGEKGEGEKKSIASDV